MKSMLDLNCMNSMKVKKKIMSCRELQAVLVFLLACCQRWLFSTLLPHELQSESRQTRVNAHLTRAQESRGGGERQRQKPRPAFSPPTRSPRPPCRLLAWVGRGRSPKKRRPPCCATRRRGRERGVVGAPRRAGTSRVARRGVASR